MIPHRPCPVTGKDDIDHKEWGVAKEYQIWSEGTNNTTAFEATASADEEDLKLFTSMASGSAASCTETPAATKENEDKSSLEQYNDKVLEFKKNKRDVFQKYVDMSIDMKCVLDRMTEDPNT